MSAFEVKIQFDRDKERMLKCTYVEVELLNRMQLSWVSSVQPRANEGLSELCALSRPGRLCFRSLVDLSNGSHRVWRRSLCLSIAISIVECVLGLQTSSSPLLVHQLHLQLLCSVAMGSCHLHVGGVRTVRVEWLACGTELAHGAIVAELLGGPELVIVWLLDVLLVQDVLDDHRFDLGVDKLGSFALPVIVHWLFLLVSWHWALILFDILD